MMQNNNQDEDGGWDNWPETEQVDDHAPSNQDDHFPDDDAVVS